jgi:hypothetical protein
VRGATSQSLWSERECYDIDDVRRDAWETLARMIWAERL